MRTPILVLTLISLLSSIQVFSQPPYLSWARSIGGVEYDSGNSIAVDASGNTITAGNFKGTVDFDPGAGTTNLTSVLNYDAFVTKLDNAGNLVWVRTIGGSGDEFANSVALDASGNVYVTGNFNGTVDLDPGAGVVNVTTAGDEDFYIVKLDASGNYVWGINMGSWSTDQALALHIDGSSNVYVTGNFRGTVDFDPGAGTAELTGSNMDMYILKLDASGNYLWARDVGSDTPSNFAGGKTVTTDASGNVLIGGFFQGTIDLDPGAGSATFTSAGDDGCIIKLNSSGGYVWSRTLGSTGQDIINDIKTDASGNVYSTGYYFESADFNPHPSSGYYLFCSMYDAFAWKLDAAGDFIWAKDWGGVNMDLGSSLYVDASGNVFITGFFSGTVDFDPSVTGSYPLASSGFSDDAFILKLNSSGDFQMAIPVGGNDMERGLSIKLDGSGMIYLTGYYGLTVDFDQGPGTYNLTSAGGSDVFIAKYSEAIILPVSLVNFSASLTSGQKVKLNFQTTSEQNAQEFIIERSADGFNYSSIGSIAAAGNSAVSKDYLFIDTDPKHVNIYRIRVVDVDGKMQYSKTIMIKLGESTQALKIFPNPVNNVLQLQTKMKGNLSIRIYGMNGQMLKTLEAVNNGISFSTTLDTDALPKGVYHLELSNGVEVERVRFFK